MSIISNPRGFFRPLARMLATSVGLGLLGVIIFNDAIPHLFTPAVQQPIKLIAALESDGIRTASETAPIKLTEAPVQISRLLHGHEIVLKEARTMARLAAEGGDDGTNDLIVSEVIRRNELQVWFVAEHVVDSPLTQTV